MPFPTRTVTSPFSLRPGPGAVGLPGWASSLAAAVLDPLLGLTTLDRLYTNLPGGDFIGNALARLGVAVAAVDRELRNIPESGAVIVVANHPTGAMDGLALAHAVMRRRQDARLLGNHLLKRVPEMREHVIAVNTFDPRSAENRRGLRAARAWLAQGGVLIVFPAGEVSNARSTDGALVDGPWQRGVLALAKWSNAAVVPAFVDASTSRWFKVATWLHPLVRTALLPRELLRLRNRSIAVRFAPAVQRSVLEAMPAAGARLAFLRAKSDALKPRRAQRPHDRQPIDGPADPVRLARDIAALDDQQELIRSGPYSVYYAAAHQLPAVLPEIGRLREATFRTVGEGTGRRRDLDRFDREYQHLFVWHRGRREIAGAYRIGATDRLCGSKSFEALYTHTLFTLDPALLHAGPMLELGRSFVRAEYQRESNTLLLLWKGIGTIVARNPRYRRLFGPASISADYSAAARAVIAGFLEGPGNQPGGSARPRHSFRPESWTMPLACAPIATLQQMDAVVKELNGGTGVPVLVRQYCKLGAQVLALGVDPAFNCSLDALMMVDLADVPPHLLQRYLGRDGAAAIRGA